MVDSRHSLPPLNFTLEPLQSERQPSPAAPRQQTTEARTKRLTIEAEVVDSWHQAGEQPESAPANSGWNNDGGEVDGDEGEPREEEEEKYAEPEGGGEGGQVGEEGGEEGQAWDQEGLLTAGTVLMWRWILLLLLLLMQLWLLLLLVALAGAGGSSSSSSAPQCGGWV